MSNVNVSREELDSICQIPVHFDSLIEESGEALVFRKTLTINDPGVSTQRVTPEWPHHLPGDLVISLTGQAGTIALKRKGIINGSWRGHGVRIRDARFSAPVFLGDTFFTKVEIGRIRRLRESIHVSFKFRMWKIGSGGEEIETYSSEQDAIFFPGS